MEFFSWAIANFSRELSWKSLPIFIIIPKVLNHIIKENIHRSNSPLKALLKLFTAKFWYNLAITAFPGYRYFNRFKEQVVINNDTKYIARISRIIKTHLFFLIC
jgi:hypothetical protein